MRFPLLRAARAAGALAAAAAVPAGVAGSLLLAACSTCKNGESPSQYVRTLNSDWKLITRKTYRYRDCSEFMGSGETTDLGVDSAVFLAGPAGETRIDRYHAENLVPAERIFSIHDTVYLLRQRQLEIFLPESLKRVPLFPVDYEGNPAGLPYAFHKWGDAGIGWTRSHFNPYIDTPLEEFLSAGDSLYRLHSQRDSILHFDREGRHQADIATFFRFEYRLAHDYWYMQGRYYGIFQNDEEGFLVVSRDDLGNHDILPIAFPPASGHVPNIRHLGYGLIELHRRQSRSDTRLKRFGFLDYGTRSITWTEAYRAHFEHGKPVFRTACESFCE